MAGGRHLFRTRHRSASLARTTSLQRVAMLQRWRHRGAIEEPPRVLHRLPTAKLRQCAPRRAGVHVPTPELPTRTSTASMAQQVLPPRRCPGSKPPWRRQILRVPFLRAQFLRSALPLLFLASGPRRMWPGSKPSWRVQFLRAPCLRVQFLRSAPPLLFPASGPRRHFCQHCRLATTDKLCPAAIWMPGV